MGRLNMVTPVAASVLKRRGGTPLDQTTVDIGYTSARSLQITDIFSKLLRHDAYAAFSKRFVLQLFVDGKSHVSATAEICDEIAE
jgi:hypothetical protein